MRRRRNGVTRRWFLVGGVSAVAAAGTCVGTPFAVRSLGTLGWWATANRPPEASMVLPEIVAKGDLTVDIDVEQLPGWSFADATLDDKPITPSTQIQINTRNLPDGPHVLRVAIRDSSLRRNVRWLEGEFISDNTPPRLALDTKLPGGTQGRTAIIQVRADEPVHMELQFAADQRVQFAREGNVYVAFVGLEPATEAGIRPVKIVAYDQAGNEATATAQFEVAKADFFSETIQLSPEMLRFFTSGEYDGELKRIGEFYSSSGSPRMWDGQFDQPVKGVISSGYGIARTYNGGAAKSRHLGIDFDIPTGTPIGSVAKGKVTFADKLNVRGNAVIVDHGVGVHSTYYHMSRLDVKAGDVVNKGHILGLSGATGLVTAPHLHLEVRISGVAVDPMEWLKRKFL